MKKCRTTGKAKFGTETHARARINELHIRPGKLRVYRCPFCTHWHFTSKPQRTEAVA